MSVGSGKPVRYDAIWEFGFLEELLGRDKVILQADFRALLEDHQVRPLARFFLPYEDITSML